MSSRRVQSKQVIVIVADAELAIGKGMCVEDKYYGHGLMSQVIRENLSLTDGRMKGHHWAPRQKVMIPAVR